MMLWYWIAWGVMFLAGEGWALANRTPGDTLSETVWYWVLGYRWTHPAKDAAGRRMLAKTASGNYLAYPVERVTAWTWRTWFVGAFLLWLFFHLTFGWFAG